MSADEQPLMVQVQGVGKRYRLGTINRQQFTDDVKAWAARLLGRPDPTVPVGAEVDPQRIGEDFWALRDISFEVRRSEVVGIVGHNGAGKSTMLKLLSRITLPTEGTIRMRGKVSSLLEVGTGFHPELTGRDNIYLNGAILGMPKAEVNAKIDEIIAFSGITHHIDTPVKRYSSGMRVRLGFAVAAHLEPEILIVDEVLSVGDAEFQRKSMGKMHDSAASGRTVLFVSHNMTAVRTLCQRVIWMEHGRIRMQGPTEEVVGAYLANYSKATTERVWSEEDAPGNAVAHLRHVRVAPASGGDVFHWEDPIDVEIGLDKHTAEKISVNIQVLNGDGAVLFTTNLAEGLPGLVLGTGRQVVSCRFPSHLFNEGDLMLNIGVAHKGWPSFRVEEAVAFTVVEPPRSGAWHARRKGMLRLAIPWQHRSTQ
ncbi:MAG: ABC transporter ATP-binding protein [Flavobacteriales bacterium]|jgi:lipopolysaccharide transport system ATP-binding protein|nr:ABC transporter ATP-binding protein [Flavobacteriales bacterium]